MPTEHTISVILEGLSECAWCCVRWPVCLAKANTQRPRAESDLATVLDPSKEWRSQEHHLRRLYWPLHLLMAPGSLLWKRDLLTPRPANQVPSSERGTQPNGKNLSSNGLSVKCNHPDTYKESCPPGVDPHPAWDLDPHTDNPSTHLESCLQKWQLHLELEPWTPGTKLCYQLASPLEQTLASSPMPQDPTQPIMVSFFLVLFYFYLV